MRNDSSRRINPRPEEHKVRLRVLPVIRRVRVDDTLIRSEARIDGKGAAGIVVEGAVLLRAGPGVYHEFARLAPYISPYGGMSSEALRRMTRDEDARVPGACRVHPTGSGTACLSRATGMAPGGFAADSTGRLQSARNRSRVGMPAQRCPLQSTFDLVQYLFVPQLVRGIDNDDAEAV